MTAQAQAYYRSLDMGENDIADDRGALIVNCAGLVVPSTAFSTYNPAGRRDYYLQYLHQGEMEVRFGEERQAMLPGQAVVYSPGYPYRYASCPGERVQYYWVHFTGRDAQELLHSCGLPEERILEVGKDPAIPRGFEELFREFIIRDGCFSLSTAAVLTALCCRMGRAARDNGKLGQTDGDERILRCLSHIHRHYRQPLTVEGLAAREHLSVSRFRQLFKGQTGLSPQGYLAVLRLNHARQLLQQSGLPVGEVAEAVGYPDQLYFSRAFRQHTGFSPSEYRLRARQPLV